MVESRLTRVLLRGGALVTLAFIYLPLFVIAPLRVQQERHAGLADREVQHEVVLGRVQRPRRTRCPEELAHRGARRDRDRTRARDARLDGGGALQLLRARDHHVRRDPPDRAPGDRHRARAPGDDHRRPRAVRAHVRAHDDHHRPRDLLRRRDLQQRDRADAPNGRFARRGVGRPRRRQLADVPVRDAAPDADGAPRRRAARLRALVRRGDRHDLHVGNGADAADLDLLEPLTTRRPADRERRRALRDRPVDHPGLHRHAAGRLERDHGGAPEAEHRVRRVDDPEP